MPVVDKSFFFSPTNESISPRRIFFPAANCMDTATKKKPNTGCAIFYFKLVILRVACRIIETLINEHVKPKQNTVKGRFTTEDKLS